MSTSNWLTWSLILCLMMSSSCSVVSSVIAGAKRSKTNLHSDRNSCHFNCNLNHNINITLRWKKLYESKIIYSDLPTYKCKTQHRGVTHPSWMFAQTPLFKEVIFQPSHSWGWKLRKYSPSRLNSNDPLTLREVSPPHPTPAVYPHWICKNVHVGSFLWR